MFCLIVALFLLAIESWIIYGSFSTILLYTLPIALLLFIFHSFFYQSRLTLILISATSSLLSLFIQRFLLALSLSTPYAMGLIFANIGVILLFSLKAIMGKTRQSLSQYMA